MIFHMQMMGGKPVYYTRMRNSRLYPTVMLITATPHNFSLFHPTCMKLIIAKRYHHKAPVLGNLNVLQVQTILPLVLQESRHRMTLAQVQLAAKCQPTREINRLTYLP